MSKVEDDFSSMQELLEGNGNDISAERLIPCEAAGTSAN